VWRLDICQEINGNVRTFSLGYIENSEVNEYLTGEHSHSFSSINLFYPLDGNEDRNVDRFNQFELYSGISITSSIIQLFTIRTDDIFFDEEDGMMRHTQYIFISINNILYMYSTRRKVCVCFGRVKNDVLDLLHQIGMIKGLDEVSTVSVSPKDFLENWYLG
jgi:hypothetical protein